jgi:cytoskeletal protein CcmA (bactofilin family)
MWNPNSNGERAVIPERRPFGSPAAPTASHETPADDTEASKIPVLGKTLFFRGELTAEEDLILQGRVEGSIRHARSLTIGSDGSVLGDVYANHLTVEGLVEGDLHGAESVIVRSTAQVRGNIFAPRVGIMEGAMFNGRVEMTSANAAAPRAAQPAAAPQGSRQQQASRPQGAAPVAPARSTAAPTAPPRNASPAPAAAPAAPATTASLPGAAVEQMLSPTQKK